MTDATIYLGQYAKAKSVETFAPKLVSEDNLCLELQIEPKSRLHKSRLVRVYLTGPEIRKLRETLAGKTEEQKNEDAARELETRRRKK